MTTGIHSAFLWLCSLAVAACSSIAGVDDSILFKIQWEDQPRETLELEHFETMRLTSADKEPYMCYVPRKLQAEGDETDVRNYRGPTPFELLEPLFANKVCRYKEEGIELIQCVCHFLHQMKFVKILKKAEELDSYWTYQLCHGRSLRQYHEDTVASKVAIMEFYLGKSDAETRKRDNEIFKMELERKLKAAEPSENPQPSLARGSADASSLTPVIKLDGVDYPSFVMNMSFGTLCDINQKPRFTQVFYICDELSDHDIHSFEESSTCMYKVIVRTPLLCKHPMYRVGTTHENEIPCHRVAGPEVEFSSDRKFIEIDKIDHDEADLNQPIKLQEMERENRDFRRGSTADSDNQHYDGEFKNLVEAIERNLKIFFLQDEEEVRSESPQQEAKDILRILSGDHCLTGGSGWWRYEFCYGKRVTQYHVEKGDRTQEILLGRWNEAKHRQWVNANPARKVPPNPLYVKHFYSDGDKCSVTGEHRSVEVKLTCKAVPGHTDAVSISLQEPRPCEYRLHVESTILCNLLTNVDEDGLPELQSPANGHRPKSSEGEDKDDRKKQSPASAAAKA